MATYTTNYNLTKPGTTDLIDVTVLNDNFDEIDTQMKTNADTAASAAETAVTDVSYSNGTLSQTIDGTTTTVFTADSTPTDGSTDPLTSGGAYAALAVKQNTLSFDATPTDGSDNPVTSNGVYDALATKQNTLTFDSTPTASSNNPVTSDGIKTALDAKQNTLTIDSALSSSSENPVQNKVINTALGQLNNQITDLNTALSEPTTNYVTKEKQYTGRVAYPVVQNGTLYLSTTVLAGIRCACYALEAGKTYKINYKTQNGLLYGWATCETYVENPQTTPHHEVGLYIDYQIDTSETYGKHESTLTPESNCYLYLNIAPDDELNLDNAVYYIDDEISVYTKSEVDELIEQSKTFIDKSKGIYFDGTAYHHFVENGNNTYIVQKFNRSFGNNLLQLTEIYLAHFSEDDSLIKDEAFGSIASDIVGPFGIASTLNGTGGYTGGVHTVNIDGVQYPTAAQKSLIAKINGNVIIEPGVYYGTATIDVVNWLYFADEITGDNLDQLDRVITEHRRYVLDDKMNVIVTIEANRTFYIGSYYGCQVIPVEMTSILLPNAQKKIVLSNMTEQYEMTTKESKFLFSNDSYNYDVSVEPIGLGEMTHTTNGYGLITANPNRKTYFYLSVADTVPHRYEVNQGEFLYWEGHYHYYKK